MFILFLDRRRESAGDGVGKKPAFGRIDGIGKRMRSPQWDVFRPGVGLEGCGGHLDGERCEWIHFGTLVATVYFVHSDNSVEARHCVAEAMVRARGGVCIGDGLAAAEGAAGEVNLPVIAFADALVD